MMAYIVAFVTGLTAGGLSCLAVQGGLLASSFADQVEQDVRSREGKGRKGQPEKRPIARPILLFLGAKLAAYTLLGLLLGALGSTVELSPLARGILQLGIAVFMLGNALRMFNVHPIFRYFAIQPPRFLTRYIRRTAKNDNSAFGPLFLGALTVLIPCGVAQAMMAVALGTSNPLAGALTMFAFTLGTSPVFFAVSYFAMRLGAAMQKYFNVFVAVVLLVLGLVALETGLNLVGSPVSFARLTQVNAAQTAQAAPGGTDPLGQPRPLTENVPPSAGADPANNAYTINVMDFGYQPNELHVKAGVPLTLTLVTRNTRSCSRAFVIPSLNLQKVLPTTGTASLAIPPQAKGTRMPFSCSMGMYTGEIFFD